ncbi:2-oxoacid:acceptor oxidoreductase family protein [Candidatus Woesearchaeota archaeon]|nr:2-oxoacid:acceptor oxidoreductase family protein [Candidatus Woesearchaeota archaeon]
MLEIRFHGRGGQGAKTAAMMLAEAAYEDGKYVQAFPEYGAAREGAPVQIYVRISEIPIRIHYNIKKPDIVVVLDDSLLKSVNVCDGLKNILLINSTAKCLDIRKKYNFQGDIYVIDATKIALIEINMNKPNTAMLGAVARLSDLKVEIIEKYIWKYFENKLEKDLIMKNVNAMRVAYEQVKECRI